MASSDAIDVSYCYFSFHFVCLPYFSSGGEVDHSNSLRIYFQSLGLEHNDHSREFLLLKTDEDVASDDDHP
jgi:hypothetical protein